MGIVTLICCTEQNLSIIGADHTVKYEKEEIYTVPPLSNWYDPDAARESLSVTLPAVTGLVSGDRLEGKIIDEDTGKILADNQTAGQAWSTVTIRYMLQNEPEHIGIVMENCIFQQKGLILEKIEKNVKKLLTKRYTWC